MAVFQIQYRRYRLNFRTPVRTAHGLWSEREGLLVRLSDEAGCSAIGEVSPIPWFGTETLVEAENVLRDLGPQVTAETLNAIPQNLSCVRNALHNAQHKLPHPTQELDVGRSALNIERSPTALPLAALLPAGRPALEKIAPKTELGFRTFKWKVGVHDIADELALLDDILAALPSGARLRLDANGAWDRRAAERWLDRVADYPVEFVEQPVSTKNCSTESERHRAEDLLLGLAGDFPTRLALDESLVGISDLNHWLQLGWLGIWVLKPSLLANPHDALARLRAAKTTINDVVFSSALETAVGAHTALDLAFDWISHLPPGEPLLAQGFGVWPLFTNQDRVFDGLGEVPFIRPRDLPRLDAEAAWAALPAAEDAKN